MTQDQLNKIWDKIKSGEFKKLAEQLNNHGWAVTPPVKLHDDDGEQAMFIPNAYPQCEWYRKKPIDKNKWEPIP